MTEQKGLLQVAVLLWKRLNWTCQTSSFHNWFCLAMAFVIFANCSGRSWLWMYKTTLHDYRWFGHQSYVHGFPRPHTRPHSPAYAVHCCTHSQYSCTIKMVSLSYHTTFFLTELQRTFALNFQQQRDRKFMLIIAHMLLKSGKFCMSFYSHKGHERGKFRLATRPWNSDTRATKWQQAIDVLSKFQQRHGNLPK